ncbi:MAG: tetratricopeptide repeat protein, partial [Pseudomonadota bacterium]
MISRPLFAATALSVAVLLSACQSDEDRLVDYLTSAQELQAAGDMPRAMLQYRNALRIDPDNVEARSAVAAALLSQGDVRQAQFEYTALAERFPEAPQWRRALGEIAFISADWPALDRHAAALKTLEPESDAARELALAAKYRDAIASDDQATATEIAAEAEDRLAAKPTDTVLLRLVVDRYLSGETPEDALPILDRALEIEPRMPELQIARLKLLSDADAVSQLETRLLELATLYPDDPSIVGLLIARHLSQGRVAEAEAILRALADGAPRGDAALPTLLVTFLKRIHGSDAALAELDRLQAGDPGEAASMLYAAMSHAIRFDAGQTEEAIAAVTGLLADLDDGAEARTIRVMLANMLDRDGNRPAARDMVDRALALDPGDVAALKLRAAWAIETDDSLAATVDLRGAQARAPRDTEVMNLLAATHAMEGKRGLALEQLARAAEMSGHGARESERYARALLADGRRQVAERVLEAALSAAPMDVALATLLAELRLDRGDWDGVRALDDHLGRLGTPAADDVRLPLRVVGLLAQG